MTRDHHMPGSASHGAEPGTGARVYRAPGQNKPGGHEVIFAAVEGRYVGKQVHVNAGHRLSLPYHRQKVETISIVHGEASIDYGADVDNLATQTFRPGDTIHLPAGAVHRIPAITDVLLAECSTARPGWRGDVVRLDNAYGRSGTSAP